MGITVIAIVMEKSFTSHPVGIKFTFSAVISRCAAHGRCNLTVMAAGMNTSAYKLRFFAQLRNVTNEDLFTTSGGAELYIGTVICLLGFLLDVIVFAIITHHG